MSSRSFLTFVAGVAVAMAIPAMGQSLRMNFPDVSSDASYALDVENMVNLGIVRGYDDGRFGPNDLLTRAQVVILFNRYDQAVVQPLRDQLAAINAKLGLSSSSSSKSSRSSVAATCGNGKCEAGEESYCPAQNCTPGMACPQYCIAGSCLRDCQSSSSNSTPNWCSPYVCNDGTTIPSCTADGHVINYFAPPCITHGGDTMR